MATQPCLSPVFAYKNRGGEEKKRDMREREEGREKKNGENREESKSRE
jgi:hypothetical protein